MACNCTGRCKIPPYTCNGTNLGNFMTDTFKEILAVCEHNVPTKLGCAQCTIQFLYDSDIKNLELICNCKRDIQELKEKIEYLTTQLMTLVKKS